MTARINRTFAFQSGVHFNDEFYMNTYDVIVDFTVESLSIREQNIALERIKYFFSECLSNSIMVRDTDSDAIEKYTAANLRVCTLPEEPYDQIVGIMLLAKLNAIAEGRLTATSISVGSSMSDSVYCMHDLDENMGPFSSSGWWSDSSASISNFAPLSKNKRIVKLAKPTVSWDDVYLSWEEEDTLIKTGPTAEIVFGSFDNKNK